MKVRRTTHIERQWDLLYIGSWLVIAMLLLVIFLSLGRIFSHHREVVTNPVSESVVQAAATPVSYRVGIQAGHWKTDELPQELSALWWNGGASAAGYDEVDINLEVAQKVAAKLEEKGVQVDVLPATIPENYKADAFVALHADGNDDTSVTGYKVAASEWDKTGEAASLSQYINVAYGAATNMTQNPTITDNMTQYYAFNYNKYVHTLDESTPGVIVEMGFITNSQDRAVFIKNQDEAVIGIAEGILKYLGIEE